MINQTSAKYPHDRVVYFSDAVFAIAITLLVIEIKVPSHERIAELGMQKALQALIPLFIGYIVSFVVSALFWKSHLQLCQHIKSFNSKLVWMNILLLLFVALMPFSTALYSENFGSNTAFGFYCVNLAMIGFMNFLMHAQVIKKEALKESIGKRAADWLKIRVLLVPIVFLLCIPLSYISPAISRFGFVLIFVFQLVGERIYKKRNVQQLPAD